MEEEECKGQPPTKITIKDGRKPAEIYRTDLITAMKIPDHQLISSGSYFDLSDQWKQEWERGVQVPVNMDSLPEPSFRIADSCLHPSSDFKMPNTLLNNRVNKEDKSRNPVLYDLDDEDVEWLKLLNRSRKNKGLERVDELLMEKAITYLEDQCYDNMGETICTSKGLSIEYDENIACDVCRLPECEDGNEILFCDVCNVAVHQACYGVLKVPVGSWVCKPCAQLLSDQPCVLCSVRGGAMKKTKLRGVPCWIHMSCALWIPEVGIGDVEKMQPITRLETIAPGRWNLLCYLCKERKGACIQCSVKTCVTAFHVTCGFNNNLEMQTVADDSAPDGVKHVCYCYKHGSRKSGRSPRKLSTSGSKSPRRYSYKSPSPTPSKSAKSNEQDDKNLRQKKLRGMEEEFYKFVDIRKVANELEISMELAKTFHRFWTLKRKARDDASLLPPTAEQQERLTGRQIKPYQRASMEIQRVVRLRQDLERIRNLCYMVEKREKQKRELTRARETVFWKELGIVSDTSGKMSSDDIRWARSCCAKNFTEYENLQSLDLSYPRKLKTYKKRAKRRKRQRLTLNNVLSSTEKDLPSNSDVSREESACEKEHGMTHDSTSNSSKNGESTTMSDVGDLHEQRKRNITERESVASEVSSSETVSNANNGRNKEPVRTCGASVVRSSRRLEDMSSDSDFEEESIRNAQRRAALRRRILPLNSPKKNQQKNGVVRRDDSASSSSGTSNTKLNGVHLDFSENGQLNSKRMKDCKTSGKLKEFLFSPSKELERIERNRKRLLADLSLKMNDFSSPKRSNRILRSNCTFLGGQMVLEKVDVLLPPKRLCLSNGVVGRHGNDENSVRTLGLVDNNDRPSSEDSKIKSEVPCRTKSHSGRARSGSLGTDIRDSGLSKNVSADGHSKSSCKSCNAFKETSIHRRRSRRSPGELSDQWVTSSSSFDESTESSRIISSLHQTAATSA